MGGYGSSYLSQGYLPESERNSATGVRTHVLRFRSSIALTITPRAHPLYNYLLQIFTQNIYLHTDQIQLNNSAHYLIDLADLFLTCSVAFKLNPEWKDTVSSTSLMDNL